MKVIQLEAALFEVWQELVQGRATHPAQPFFDSGGDSMLLVEFQVALASMGLEVPYMALFEFPSVSALVGRLAQGPVHDA